MGMSLYNSSPACAVWDAADEHLLAVNGFSIIDITKHNLKEKTVHFGGIKGQANHQRHNARIDMTCDTLDKDGHVKTLDKVCATAHIANHNDMPRFPSARRSSS